MKEMNDLSVVYTHIHSNQIEIIIQKIFSKRVEIIKYQDIVKIESRKHRFVSKAGYINDGSFSRLLTLNSGKLLEISPNVFENYNKCTSLCFVDTVYLL